MNIRLLDRASASEAQEKTITIGYLLSYGGENLFFTDYQCAIAKLTSLHGAGIFPIMQEITSRGRQKNEIVKNYMNKNNYNLINAIPLVCRITGDIYYLVNHGMDNMFPGKFLNISLYIMRNDKLKLIESYKKYIIKNNGLHIEFEDLNISLRDFDFYHVKFEE